MRSDFRHADAVDLVRPQRLPVARFTNMAYQDAPSGSADKSTLARARGKYSARMKSCSSR